MNSTATMWPIQRYTTLSWVLQHENQGVCAPGLGLVRVSYQVVIHDLANNIIVNIEWVQVAVDMIYISWTQYYSWNHLINLVIISWVWPKAANANENVQTNENDTMPQEYHKNQKAGIVLDMNKDDTEQEEAEDKEEEDNEDE